MATYLEKARLANPPVAREAAARPPVALDTDAAGPPGRSASRGILIAVMISAPLWALIAVAIYLLL